MISFTIEQKRIDVFPGARPNTPAIYLNTYGQEGKQVFQYMRETGCPDFSLVACQQSGMGARYGTLGHSAYLGQRCAPVAGGADGYLKLLLNQILPKAEKKQLPGIPSWRGNRRILPGRTVCSVFDLSNGCLFTYCQVYPVPCGFLESKSTSFPICLRKSLPVCTFRWATGNVIPETNFWKCVQQNTEALESFYRQQGIDTIFRLNPGNHFRDGVLRTAAGLQWILEQRT